MNTKLWILTVLTLIALMLMAGILTLQFFIVQEKVLQQRRQSNLKGGSSKQRRTSGNAHEEEERSAQAVSDEQHFARASQRKHYWTADDGASSSRTPGKAYWNMARAFMHWDSIEGPVPRFDFDEVDKYEDTLFVPSNQDLYRNGTATDPIFFLQQAADAGHPTAQHYAAVAYASGIWPVASYGNDAHSNHLLVTEDFVDLTAGDMTAPQHQASSSVSKSSSQLIQAYLYWHMAAMGGNIEAAMALAHRIDHVHSDTEDTPTKSKKGKNSPAKLCPALPYYEAAAHGIIDQLVQYEHSRGKVIPPQDQHSLAQVHMHGGQSSVLGWKDKPSESKEAIQYYHIRATMGITVNGKSSDAATKSTSSSTAVQPDIKAAYALAQMYHFGANGVPQNLTSALFYYSIAADYGNSWEAAGHAGMCYFWGLGLEKPDYNAAWEYFEMGAPVGLEGCRRSYEKSTRKSNQKQKGKDGDKDDDDDEDSENDDVDSEGRTLNCDARSLNGLGLIYLHGVPGEQKPDLVKAEQFFTLAKELGSIDAHYNLAMMWLGWKTHFKDVKDLPQHGTSTTSGMDHPFQKGSHIADDDDDDDDDEVAPGTDKSSYALHKSVVPGKDVYKGPTQKEYSDAIKMLNIAANKDHLLARHRMGMIFAHGIKVRGNDGVIEFDIIKPDCSRAKAFYKWVVNRASLDRSKRLRNAYKHYTNGNLVDSLRNYLIAAETGSSMAKSNAAFLLERGTCLDLSPHDCAKASIRLWKVAAMLGDSEACLRVGDFYYYGRMRISAQGKERQFGYRRVIAPLGWMQYIIFPEEYLPNLVIAFHEKLYELFSNLLGKKLPPKKGSNEVDDDADTDAVVQRDLAMAAHYYAIGVEKYDSSRANFNLGFMHEWGLGVAQDFPLAKRHYDLAGASATEGSNLSIVIALSALAVHENFVKMEMALIDWLDEKLEEGLANNLLFGDRSDSFERVAGSPRDSDKRPTEVIVSHLFRLDSLLIVVLTYLLYQVMELRRKRRA